MDTNRGAKRAREAREALANDVAGPLDLLATVEGAGLRVVVTVLPEGVAGACYAGALLWVNGDQGKRRQRFTLAHELGHAWCKHDGRLEPDTFETLSGRTSNPLEIQANAFAAEFLVPRTAMEERITHEPTLEDVVRIAAEFGVSAVVVVYRLQLLKLASARRVAQLHQEVGLHKELFEYPSLDDRLEELNHLPYLSPGLRGSHLEAALRGEAAVDEATAGALGRLLR